MLRRFDMMTEEMSLAHCIDDLSGNLEYCTQFNVKKAW